MVDFKERLRLKRAAEAEEKAKRKKRERKEKEPIDISPAAQGIVDASGVGGNDSNAFFKAIQRRLNAKKK